MTVVLELGPKLEEALRKKASVKGVVLDSYLLDVLAKDVEPTYEEVMAPLWKECEESGMTVFWRAFFSQLGIGRKCLESKLD